MNQRKLLGISIATGVAAATVAWIWLSAKERALADLSAPAPALVAEKYIASGARIDKSLVAVRMVPRAFIQPGALRAAEEAEGQMALAPMAPGEQILANKMTTGGVALALAVPPGKRAVTLAVDPAGGVAGLLKPGDLVDVFVTSDDGAGPRTIALIQGAPVLAVGRNFSAQPAKTEAQAFGDVSDGTVTLAALPFEAEQLTHLEQTVRIKLVLRAPGDRERIPLPAITGRQIKPAAVSDDEPVHKR